MYIYNHQVQSHNCHILNVTTHGNDDEHDNGEDGDDETKLSSHIPDLASTFRWKGQFPNLRTSAWYQISMSNDYDESYCNDH